MKTPDTNTNSPKKILRLAAVAALIFSGATSFAQSPTNVVAVYNAAQAFLATLSSSQSNSTVYSLLLTNARNWSNLPIGAATRNGPRFDSLSAAQVTAALNLATNALGTNGAWLFNEIRLADGLLATSASGYSSNYYYIAFVGAPSTNSPWILQLGGHHIGYNVSFNTTNLSATPFFVGVEPKVWTNSGVIHSPLTNKFAAVLNLRQALTSSALLSGTFSDIVFGANGSGNHDNYPQTYPTSGRGQLVSALSASQQALVKAVIEAWVTNSSPAVSSVLLPIYESDLALSQTYVGYSGSDATMGTQGSYVRVDGPRVWIEFICQNGIVYSGIHFHTIWRDKLSDYGSSFGVCTTNVVPTISTQPTNRTATAGNSTTFTVGVSGTAPFVYQWYKDSSAITDATNASYTIASVAAGNAGTYSVYVLNNVGTVTSSNATLTVSAAATNTAPALSAISDRTITPGTSLSITNVATDSDTPAQTLTFALLTAPTNATLGASSGILAWRPLIAQADSTNAFSVSVTDSGSPAMSATQSFTVFVSAATAPSNSSVSYTAGTCQFSVAGIVGPDYIIQASTNLSSWETLYSTNPSAMPFSYTDTSASNYAVRFFRVLLGP
ncbi:MAG: DUF3500 domain-containing protein [Verrucomicrobia bacterium]|nr:MAG: DUF3500 domain-containing protein [Verrucomicrobiota bacterium]